METTKLMYQINKSPFGSLEQVHIGNGENELSFVPSNGGFVTDLKFKLNNRTFNIIDGYQDEESLINKDYYKSAFLLPFPNRLNEGKYTYKGKNYEFPINDTECNNALHGFEDCYEMQLQDVRLNGENAEVVLHHSYNGQNPAYPFPFEFTVIYTLSENNSFECEVKIENPNDFTIPIGFGWHPYFKLGNLPVEKLELQMPTVDQVLIDDRMLPTGEFKSVNTYNLFTNLTGKEFDTCFKSIDGSVSEVVINAASINTKLSYWQENEAFPYFQVFIPPKRKSIAIEPMTCNVNAFNRPDDLKELNGNERLRGKFGVLVTGY